MGFRRVHDKQFFVVNRCVIRSRCRFWRKIFPTTPQISFYEKRAGEAFFRLSDDPITPCASARAQGKIGDRCTEDQHYRMLGLNLLVGKRDADLPLACHSAFFRNRPPGGRTVTVWPWGLCQESNSACISRNSGSQRKFTLVPFIERDRWPLPILASTEFVWPGGPAIGPSVYEKRALAWGVRPLQRVLRPQPSGGFILPRPQSAARIDSFLYLHEHWSDQLWDVVDLGLHAPEEMLSHLRCFDESVGTEKLSDL